jgi:hypothetical protein
MNCSVPIRSWSLRFSGGCWNLPSRQKSPLSSPHRRRWCMPAGGTCLTTRSPGKAVATPLSWMALSSTDVGTPLVTTASDRMTSKRADGWWCGSHTTPSGRTLQGASRSCRRSYDLMNVSPASSSTTPWSSALPWSPTRSEVFPRLLHFKGVHGW